jgi:hypothetical protein
MTPTFIIIITLIMHIIIFIFIMYDLIRCYKDCRSSNNKREFKRGLFWISILSILAILYIYLIYLYILILLR